MAGNLRLEQLKHAVGSARSIARENKQTLDGSPVIEVVEAWNVAKAQNKTNPYLQGTNSEIGIMELEDGKL